jgi:hypothetical protein
MQVWVSTRYISGEVDDQSVYAYDPRDLIYASVKEMHDEHAEPDEPFIHDWVQNGEQWELEIGGDEADYYAVYETTLVEQA